jgi:hypothetical protein
VTAAISAAGAAVRPVLLEKGDEVLHLLFVLETSVYHLVAGHHALGVGDVFREELFRPRGARLFVGLAVIVTRDLAGLALVQPVQMGTDGVARRFAHLMAGAALREDPLPGLCVLGERRRRGRKEGGRCERHQHLDQCMVSSCA